MSNRIMGVIESMTKGTSYKTHRFCYDSAPKSGIEYDSTNEPEKWCSKGETIDHKDKNIDLKQDAADIADSTSRLKYFLDGSRYTYKIDDVSYANSVYPVIAGQIGVGCCSRTDKMLHTEFFNRKLVISLPDKASDSEWHKDLYLRKVTEEINKIKRLDKIGVVFDDIIPYSTSLKGEETFEKHGISKIQDEMIEMEKRAVSDLVANHKLNGNAVLIKDGSLEYQKSNKVGGDNDLRSKKFRQNYENVLGLSKSFNPTKCYASDGKQDSRRIARLKPFERTPANMYHCQRAGDVWFAVWYVRIRDAKYSNNIFDGILKVEKIIDGEPSASEGEPLETDEIDSLTANILNERNPVCYGSDSRWANHIYPIYLTEKFLKSKYLSSNLFMELF